jgi:hypothetical protein
MKRSHEDIHEELRAIYAEDGEMPDLTRLERKSESSFTRFLIKAILVLALLSGAAWGGFLVWSRGWFASGKPLTVSVEGPARVSAGQAAFFTVRYENTSNAPIATLNIAVNLPREFELHSATPAATENETRWNIGPLSPGSDGAITLSGVFRSSVGTSQTLQAVYTYESASYRSTFQDIATSTVQVDASVVSLSVSGPSQTVPGDEAVYTINVQNHSAETLERLQVAASLPAGFQTTTLEPASRTPDTALWTLERIDPGAIVAFTVKGRFPSGTVGEQTVRAAVAFLSEADYPAQQSEAEVVTSVLGGVITFHLVINGTTSDQDVDVGDTLRASIDYSNEGTDSINGLSFALNLESVDDRPVPIDWERADLAGALRNENVITWGVDQFPDFERLSPSTEGTIDIILPLKEIASAETADVFRLTLSTSLQGVGAIASPRTIQSTPVTFSINSNLAASTSASYYTPDGEPVGTGPLPPKVGETTTYRLGWHLTNTLHPLTDITMSTNLPPAVAWTGNTTTTIGVISFDTTTRLVTWTINKLPKDVKTADATFDVAITPEKGNVGSYFKLTNATGVEATDTATHDTLTRAIDILTTELAGDEFASGKGVVEE